MNMIDYGDGGGGTGNLGTYDAPQFIYSVTEHGIPFEQLASVFSLYFKLGIADKWINQVKIHN